VKPTPSSTILNVDDNEPALYAKTRILRRAGFHVLEARDGTTALRLVAQAMPQLVLLDVQLPDVSGLEVCRRIKSDPATRRIPVLHISATHVSETDQQIGMESGAEIYLVEPLAPEELITVVRTLLRLRQTEAGLAASEERLRLATESAGFGTCDIDLRTGNAVFSVAMFDILGLSAAPGPASMNAWIDRIHPDDLQATIAAFDAARDASTHFRHEHRIVRASDGDERWLAPTGLFHPDEAGQRTRFIGVMLDVTERRSADVERNALLARESAARAAAEEAARIKDQFLATLSHELRTPMSAVLGWLHLLKSGRLTTVQQTQALETIERNARLQNQLINDLLDVSRIITGRLRLERDRVYPSVVVEAAIAAVRPQADARAIQIRASLPNVPVTVFGDPMRLQQVVSNILVNAIKFSHDQSVIDVSMRVEGDKVEIAIADQGEGIAADMLPLIFERFRQADGSITRRHGGMGLGLAIARHILDLHGGSITARSDGLGRGATFTMTLPAEIDHVASADSVADAGEMQPEDRLAGLHVLAVDDDANALSMLASMLELGGARVTTTQTASAALAAFATNADIAIVLSDIGMPVHDGYELVTRLRREHSERMATTPAIAVSGYARDEDLAHALRTGFDAHIAKPFGMNALFDLIVRLVRERAPAAADGRETAA
jgi:PAS domain S-box-containing protein